MSWASNEAMDDSTPSKPLATKTNARTSEGSPCQLKKAGTDKIRTASLQSQMTPAGTAVNTATSPSIAKTNPHGTELNRVMPIQTPAKCTTSKSTTTKKKNSSIATISSRSRIPNVATPGINPLISEALPKRTPERMLENPSPLSPSTRTETKTTNL